MPCFAEGAECHLSHLHR